MNRRKLREAVFCLLYCRQFYPAAEFEEQMELFLDHFSAAIGDEPPLFAAMEEADREEIERKIRGIGEQTRVIDAAISQASRKWTIDRIDRIDLVILRLAYYEMAMDETVPAKVAVNEAVELAKKYGQDNSPAFINGVLSNLMQQLEQKSQADT
ncbi:MAG: transcription antitermination factor NusB [Lachnospiraceae bacterium]|nr:transcription antitermination factor NusB [Lachnospiraceae bacterium]